MMRVLPRHTLVILASRPIIDPVENGSDRMDTVGYGCSLPVAYDSKLRVQYVTRLPVSLYPRYLCPYVDKPRNEG
jgi:hypothetical protein